MLDEIFQKLETATQLESTGSNRIEAATKYYEAIYLMRSYLQCLSTTGKEGATRKLLEQKATQFEKRASMLMADESSTMPTRSRSSSTSLSSYSSRANTKLSQALDLDEAQQTTSAIAAYMQAAELYLEAIKLVEELRSAASSESQSTTNLMKRRLDQILDRVEVLKQAQLVSVLANRSSKRPAAQAMIR